MPDLFLLVWRLMHYALANKNNQRKSSKFDMRGGVGEETEGEGNEDVGANREESTKEIVSVGKGR